MAPTSTSDNSRSTNGQSDIDVFAQAATAAHALRAQLGGYQSALSRLESIEGQLSGLKKSVERLSAAADKLAGSAESASGSYDTLATAKADIEGHLSLVKQAAEQTAGKVKAELATTEASLKKALTDGTNQSVATLGTGVDDALDKLEAPLSALSSVVAQARSETERLRTDIRTTLQEAHDEHKRTFSDDFKEMRWVTRTAALAAVLALLAVLFLGNTRNEGGIPLDKATVQVLNGTSPTEPLAGYVVAKLRDTLDGTEVLAGRDAASVGYGLSVILLHGASRDAGNELASTLGIPEDRVVPGTPAPLNGDLTVVIGADRAGAGRIDWSER